MRPRFFRVGGRWPVASAAVPRPPSPRSGGPAGRRLVVVALVLLAGCGSPGAAPAGDPAPGPDSAELSPAPPASGPSPARRPRGPGTEIITAASEYGPMLYDAGGQPIYLFTAETRSRPGCYDDCAAAWPPVLTRGAPRGSGDVRDHLLGTTRRADGTTQVTYAGHPLYYYANEGKYQVLCHDVTEFGGTWLVVRPDGTPAPG